MGKLSMCRICLAENVRMCVVTDKSLQETYEKLTDVPFVTEDRRPMLACFFCCTRLKQCCQLQRKCVEAEELLAQMLSDDYEKKPLLNREQLGFFGGYITTPVENISIVDDCQIGSDAIKQELPAVCEEQDDVEIELPHLSEELIPENVYNSHPNVEAHHSSEPHEYQCGMEIKIELAEEHEQTDKLDLQNPDKSYPGVEDIPARDSGSDSEDNVPLVEIKIEAEEGPGVSKQGVSANQRAALVKKPTLKRKPEDSISTNVPSNSKIKRTSEPSTADSFTNITTTSQSSFSESSNLIKYTRMHTGETPFKCNICQRSFSNKSNLNQHVQIHTGEKPFKCNICEKSFTQKSSLNVHLKNHSGKRRFKCDVCQQSFNYKNNLNVHLRTHTGIKPFQCDICQKSFTIKCNLLVHIRSHTGEKPFKCDICLRSFLCKSKLDAHFRVHSGEKPFKCNLCWRSYTQLGYLKEHMYVHDGETPFKCGICQRTFMRSNSLKQHIRIHTGDTPHKCDVCQRGFTCASHLKEHVRVHTGEKPFKCDACQHCFSSKRKLKLHLRKHSGDPLNVN